MDEPRLPPGQHTITGPLGTLTFDISPTASAAANTNLALIREYGGENDYEKALAAAKKLDRMTDDELRALRASLVDDNAKIPDFGVAPKVLDSLVSSFQADREARANREERADDRREQARQFRITQGIAAVGTLIAIALAAKDIFF
jgi:hypothetical protein